MAIDRNDDINGPLGAGGPQDPNAQSSQDSNSLPPIPSGEQPDFWSTPKGELLLAIYQLIKAIKSGKPIDKSTAIASVMAKMNAISGGIVKADSDTMTAMNKYDAASSNMQSAISDETGAPVPLINQYTGKPELNAKGEPVMGTPEQAIAQDAQFIKNNPNQPYELNNDGSIKYKMGPDGKPTTTPVPNRTYTFFHANNGKNMDLYNSMSTNVDSVLKGIDPNCNTSGTSDSQYPSGSSGNKYSISKDAVEKMWNKINKPQPTKSGAPGKPDSTQLQAVQSAHASLVQSLSSNSSAIQSIAKQDATHYQSATSTLTKFEQSWLTIMKTCNSSIKAAG